MENESQVTNVSDNVQIHNNIWTFTKHIAGSVNKAAAKVDAKVYGPIVKERTVQLPPQRSAPAPVPQEHANVFTIIGYVVVGIIGVTVAVAVFIAYCKGDIKGRDIIGI